MSLFEITFTGRKLGAIGIMQHFRRIVSAETPEAARLKLYETHEHVTNATLRQMSDTEGAQPEGVIP